MASFKSTFIYISLCSVTVLSSGALAQSGRLPNVNTLYGQEYGASTNVNGGYPYNSNTLPAATTQPPIIGTSTAKRAPAPIEKAAPPTAFKQPVGLAPAKIKSPEYPSAETVMQAPAYVPNVRPISAESPSQKQKQINPTYANAPAYTPPASEPPQPIEAIPNIAKAAPPAKADTSPIAPPPQTIASSPLSKDTLDILKGLPRYVASTKKISPGRVSVNRANVNDALDMNVGKTQTADSIGMSIAVKEYTFSDEYELQRAYDAIANGDTALANSIYESILNNHPNNQDALFGYATLNQRLENKRRAREVYGRLLRLNPKHTEGLNNFLALVIEESPTEALPYLQALIKNNPEFAPGYAQIAKVYQYLNDDDRARNAMSSALALDPDNLVYRYNYAVLLDEQKHYKAASELYISLIRASSQGQPIPADAEQIQQRLRFIQTTSASS